MFVASNHEYSEGLESLIWNLIPDCMTRSVAEADVVVLWDGAEVDQRQNEFADKDLVIYMIGTEIRGAHSALPPNAYRIFGREALAKFTGSETALATA